jgi:homoserine kinase
MKRIRVRVPATVANLVCGFDILGMAVQEPADEMELELTEKPGIEIIHTDDFGLPGDPSKNVTGAALEALLKQLNEPVGFKVKINKTIKPGSGLGSSAASAAGAVVAANHLLGKRFNDEELVQFAMFGEKLASGVKHADNIAPCIFGGITLIRSIFPLDIVCIEPPDLFVTIVHPQIEVKTSDARQILKKELLLKDAIKQWGNIAGLVAGLIKKDINLIGRSMEDVVVEPFRKILVPGFDDIKNGCKETGVLGGGISGSGPSVFMLSSDNKIALHAELVMREVYDKMGINYKTYVTKISPEGVKILE